MHTPPSSPFHTELFNYLVGHVEKKMKEEGVPLEKHLIWSHKPKEESLSFQKVLDIYHQIFSEKKSQQLEQKLLEAFPQKEFPLKISRGLPRLFYKNNPSLSHIKKEFSHLPSLKRLALDKFLLPRYLLKQIPKGAKICLFTYVLADGWGDFIAHKEVFHLLKKHFPNLSIQSIVCIPDRFPLKQCKIEGGILIPYSKGCPISSLSKTALELITSTDLVLSIPTIYPHLEKLKQKTNSKARFISIGQYGFIESEWFHPKSSNYSMGLHFLEKGILTREISGNSDFLSIENKKLLTTLFGSAQPKKKHLEKYLNTHKFYLAYLVSSNGGAIYLHALLQSQTDDKTIDICSPDLGWLIAHIKEQNKKKKPLFEDHLGISRIEIHFKGKIHKRTLAKTGKIVRIICPGNLSDSDFRKAMIFSQEFVAVRGDQSFSEAVSLNKSFFYDGAPHAKYFIKDLVALAENKLNQNQEALQLFRCMGKAFLHNSPEENTDLVEDSYFQDKQPWEEIAKELASSLKSTNTILGCKKLNQIIKNEYSCNQTICQIVTRELLYKLLPHTMEKEEKQILSFIEGKQTLKETLDALI
jgi:hypothetical protein